MTNMSPTNSLSVTYCRMIQLAFSAAAFNKRDRTKYDGKRSK